jgi:tRNA pseudouridine55 synthase
MTRQRSARRVDGILLLDKPHGMGSNEALQIVKGLFRARKAGHTGSLDRLATGLLPICFGEATKLSGFLLNANKRYHAVFKLGVKTTTGDAEGEIVAAQPAPTLAADALEGVLGRFRGDIEQVPPMYSAIKLGGQRLYKLAHQGLVVDRQARVVTIHRLRLLEVAGDCLRVDVICSKGTYIRTLAEDIGEVIGCGAHVEWLRRVACGPFESAQMLTLEEVRKHSEQGLQALDGSLLDMELALADWPHVTLTEDVAYYLRHGQAVLVPHAPTRGWVRLHGDREKFLGIGEVLDDGRIAPRRLVHQHAS